MNDLSNMLNNLGTMINVVTGIGTIAVTLYIIYVVLKFVASILRSGSKTTFGDLILLIALTIFLPNIVYTLIVDINRSISSALRDSYPSIQESQQILNTFLYDAMDIENDGLPTPNVSITPTTIIETATPQISPTAQPPDLVATETPTYMVPSPTPIVILTPTLNPTIDLNNYNPMTPPPTPIIP